MRVLLVWPGHTGSTFNTAYFYNRAFREAGVKVANFSYHNELIYANASINALRGTQNENYEGESILLASRMLMGYVASSNPDAVVVVTALALYKSLWKWMSEFRHNLKRPFRIVGIFTESPYRDSEELELAQWCDYIYTNEREFVGRLRRFQPRSWYLPQAYDPEIHRPGDAEKRYGVYMCGSGFLSRIDILRQIDWGDLGADLTLKGIWPDLEGTALEPYYTEGIVPNDDVVQDYWAADINLNIHRQEGERLVFEIDRPNFYKRERRMYDVQGAYSFNNRTCEIAAAGGFQLVDDSRDEVADVFGDSIPQFRIGDPEDLADKIAYYSPRPELRAKLARESMMRVQGRTYLANVFSILNNMEAHHG